MDPFWHELAGLVRTALSGWSGTIRLCLVCTVVAATCIIVRHLVL